MRDIWFYCIKNHHIETFNHLTSTNSFTYLFIYLSFYRFMISIVLFEHVERWVFFVTYFFILLSTSYQLCVFEFIFTQNSKYQVMFIAFIAIFNSTNSSRMRTLIESIASTYQHALEYLSLKNVSRQKSVSLHQASQQNLHQKRCSQWSQFLQSLLHHK